MIAVAAITFEVPRKSGPPESPKHVPPAPTELFCVSRSQDVLSELKNDVANQRKPSNAKVGDPPPWVCCRFPSRWPQVIERPVEANVSERPATAARTSSFFPGASRSTGVDISLESGP